MVFGELIICRAFATARALELCERPDPEGPMKSPRKNLVLAEIFPGDRRSWR